MSDLKGILHKMNSPLTALMGYTSMLKKSLGNNITDAQKEYIKNIEKTLEDLKNQIAEANQKVN